MPKMFAEVAIDKRSNQCFDYEVLPEMQSLATIGMRVLISFRNQEIKGTIVSLKNSSSYEKTKPILALCSKKSLLSEKQHLLSQWISSYYATPIEKVMRLFIPSAVRKEVQQKKRDDDLLLEASFLPSQPKKLTEEQKNCLSPIVLSLQKGGFSSHLIEGVTGSGKTEIYLQAIEEARRLKKGALFLVPEISLTSQTIERFRSRFNEKIAVLHHRKSLGERNEAWQKLLSGEISIAIGARSLIFAPMQNLGLIIVDEEHDGSYKQTEEMPCYHARNVGVMRAYLESATILLGSATPSVESRYNAEIGKYQHHLLTKRATNASLPKISIIDMRKVFERNKGFTHFSDELLAAIEKRFKQGEQTLLFLNKRGYHRLQTCANCQKHISCPHCDLALTFHKKEETLRCHLCDFSRKPPRSCPECGSIETLEFKGFGTEHVERSLHAIFPGIKTLRMDKDTTKAKEGHEELFKQFRSHKADVLIGTQMIAKGLHFPSVTLVGVLNADSSLQIPDFRSGESLFQLLTQVAGRAGRAELEGEVILQTHIPDHPVIQLAKEQNYESFYRKEIEERKLFLFPPFTHLIKCLFSSKEEEKAKLAAETTYQMIVEQKSQEMEVFPPLPSGHPKIKDLYRYQFLIKIPRKVEKVTTLLKNLKIDSVQMKVDVDTLSTFF